MSSQKSKFWVQISILPILTILRGFLLVNGSTQITSFSDVNAYISLQWEHFLRTFQYKFWYLLFSLFIEGKSSKPEHKVNALNDKVCNKLDLQDKDTKLSELVKIPQVLACDKLK